MGRKKRETYWCPACGECLDPAVEDHTFTDARGRIWHNSCAARHLGSVVPSVQHDLQASQSSGKDGGV